MTEIELPEWLEEGSIPPSSKREQGWEEEERPPAEWFNWLFNRTYVALKAIEEGEFPVSVKEDNQNYRLVVVDGSLALEEVEE